MSLAANALGHSSERWPRPDQTEGEEWERANPLGLPEWDRLVLSHPGASFFHSVAWARVLHDCYGFTPMAYLARRQDCLLGLMPMMETRAGLVGRRGVSLPFSDESPLLDSPGVSLGPALARVLNEGRARGWRTIEWRGASPVFGQAPPALSFYTHRLELHPEPERLLGGCDETVRRAIRKAERSGLVMETTREERGLREYYGLHCLTRQRHGLPPQPWSFFRAIGRRVLSEGGGDVVLARWNGRAVAGAVFFRFGPNVLYKYGACDPVFQGWRPNNLVMWTAIGHYARLGLAGLQWGRTSLGNAGLRRFKLGWGTQEGRLDYYKYDLRRQQFVTERDRTAGWHTVLLRRLPRPVLRLMGWWLYRYLA